MERLPKLPVAPPPLPGELLIAWIARLAAIYHQDPQGFLDEVVSRPAIRDTYWLWGDPAWAPHLPWTSPRGSKGDVWWLDAFALDRLYGATGVPPATLSAMAPQAWDFVSGRVVRATFLGPVGLCPQCLAEDVRRHRPPFVRRDWAVAWGTMCQQHRRPLIACSNGEVAGLAALAERHRHLLPFVRNDRTVCRVMPGVSSDPHWIEDCSGPGMAELWRYGGSRQHYLELFATSPTGDAGRPIAALWAADGDEHGPTIRDLCAFEAAMARSITAPHRNPGQGVRGSGAIFLTGVVDLCLILESRFLDFPGFFKHAAPLSAQGTSLSRVMGSIILEAGVSRLKCATRRARPTANSALSWPAVYGAHVLRGRAWLGATGDPEGVLDRLVRNAVLASIVFDRMLPQGFGSTHSSPVAARAIISGMVERSRYITMAGRIRRRFAGEATDQMTGRAPKTTFMVNDSRKILNRLFDDVVAVCPQSVSTTIS